MIPKNKKKSDPDNLGNCQYYCNGENKAVAEVWYKPICNPCFRQLMKETTENIREEIKRKHSD